MQITIIAGARPNFMKIAPIVHALEGISNREKLSYRLVHTGQHYDRSMSGTFFDELRIPEPNINLNCTGKTQAEQTSAIMMAFENELAVHPADLVLVVGDVTSTIACAIVAKKANLLLAHVEAGIRSKDLTMPEEINRLVTDSITDIFFTTTRWATDNLVYEGHSKEKIHFVGNVMIDTLLANRNRFRKPVWWEQLSLKKEGYILVTLHRPANVDEPMSLSRLLDEIVYHAGEMPVVFPMHPRTRKVYDRLEKRYDRLHVINPLGYLEFNYLVSYAKMVITDSGGITEETTVLGIPCLTLRDNTERPETVEIGTNELIGTNPLNIGPAMVKVIHGNWKKGTIPELWDGKAAERIAQHLLMYAG